MSNRRAFHAESGLLDHKDDFTRFYDYYAPTLYGYLLRQTNNVQVAETLLADTFLTAWHRREEFNQDQSGLKKHLPLTWLLSIVHEKGFTGKSA